jgi:hypothetical protein
VSHVPPPTDPPALSAMIVVVSMRHSPYPMTDVT